MTEILAIINQKGGVGKSTTAQAIGQGLAEIYKKKVLFVDLDAQGNLSYSLDVQQSPLSVLDVLTGKEKTKDVIVRSSQGDILPSNIQLSGADLILTEMGKEYKLKEALEPVLNDYDYIILDTPPALGILTVNALTASTGVIIPAQADIYSLQGIGQLSRTFEAVRKYCNKNLELRGIVLTRYNKRAILSRDVADLIEETAKGLNTKVYKTQIREAIAIREAQIKRVSLFKYAPKSNASADYRNLIKEVINNE